MKSLSSYYLPLVGIITGAIGGYLYYYFIGCADGTCMITSRPMNSTLYGAVLGGLLFSMFQKEKK
jgi:LytS/YehU family sensor histidine kinase